MDTGGGIGHDRVQLRGAFAGENELGIADSKPVPGGDADGQIGAVDPQADPDALSNLGEVTVSTQTALETRGSRNAILDQGFASIIPFLDQRLAHR